MSATRRRSIVADGEFGQRVRELRKGKGWTLEELAERAYITKPNLSKIENGAPTTPVIAWALANALGARLEYLTHGTHPLELQTSIPKTEVQALWDRLNQDDRDMVQRLMSRLVPPVELKVVDGGDKPKRQRKRPPSQPVQLVRLAIDAAAGQPIDSEDSGWREEVEVPEDLIPTKGKAVVIRAQGDSMIDINIHDGDRLLCYAVAGSFNYHRGEVVVAQVGESDFTVKRYVRQHKGNIYLAPENSEMELQVYPREECVIVAVDVARCDNGEKWYPVPRRDGI